MLENQAKQISQSIEDEHGFPIPWMLIIQIAIMLIDRCFKNEKAFVTACRAPTIMQRIGFLHIAREHGIRDAAARHALAEAVFEFGKDAEETTLAGCYQETRALLDPREGPCHEC